MKLLLRSFSGRTCAIVGTLLYLQKYDFPLINLRYDNKRKSKLRKTDDFQFSLLQLQQNFKISYAKLTISSQLTSSVTIRCNNSSSEDDCIWQIVLFKCPHKLTWYKSGERDGHCVDYFPRIHLTEIKGPNTDEDEEPYVPIVKNSFRQLLWMLHFILHTLYYISFLNIENISFVLSYKFHMRLLINIIHILVSA